MANNIKRQTVLINDAYLREYSLFPKNFDLTEIRNFIPIAEQIHIIPIIGNKLYEELIEQIEDNTLSPENSTLLLEIYKVEGIAVVFEALPFQYAHLSQVGMTKGKSDNSDSIDNKDINYISTHLQSQLNYSKKYLKEWLDAHAEYFPLYEIDGCDCTKKLDIANNDYGFNSLKKDLIDFI